MKIKKNLWLSMLQNVNELSCSRNLSLAFSFAANMSVFLQGSSRNNQPPSLPSTQVSIKPETKVQTLQEANLPGQLNQEQHSGGQPNQKSRNKLSRLAPDTAAGTEHASPPDHGQPAAEEDDARGDFTAAAKAAPAEDGYSWRKYGQKQVKHSEYPRSYYKCTHPSCQVKKKVERSHEGHVTEIIYKGTHNHPKPVQSRRPGVAAVHPFGDASDNAGSQANPWQNNNASVQGDSRGDGVDATSSPSVPGELCDSSASMQVHDGARFESPEGVDVASAVSDEVDGDRGAHGSLSQGVADAEGEEQESKRRSVACFLKGGTFPLVICRFLMRAGFSSGAHSRTTGCLSVCLYAFRKLEAYAIDMGSVSRAVREPRVVIQTTSEVDILDDGYRWRKYGQKVVKGNPNPRFSLKLGAVSSELSRLRLLTLCSASPSCSGATTSARTRGARCASTWSARRTTSSP
jgi:WRKY transcription factor 2